MRHSIRLALAAAPLLMTVACEKARHDPRTATAAPSLAALDVITNPIDTLVTLGAWVSDHPGDTVSQEAPRGGGSERLCRVARGDVVVGARRVQRSAIFLLPEPGDDLTLPSDTTRIAERYCHLWSIWLETREPDSVRAIALADSFAQRLVTLLGASRSEIPWADLAPGGLRRPRSWTGRGTSVAIGIAPPDSFVGEFTRDTTRYPRQVVAAAYATRSGRQAARDYVWIDDGSGRAEREMLARRIDSAIAWVSLPLVAADLRSVQDYLERSSDRAPLRTPATDSALLRAVRMVRDSSPTLDPARRAAALFAADMIVNTSAGDMADDTVGTGAELRSAMESLGLGYDHDPLGSTQVYTRPWLWEAYRADSAGRVGHEAFLTLLENGWTTKPNCQDGAAQYDEVLKHGEAALQRGDRDPMLHYYMGIANHDIVALSLLSEYDDYVDHSGFIPLAPAARARAVEHFRVFLASPADARLRRHAWRAAMTLLSGGALRVRYFCIYD